MAPDKTTTRWAHETADYRRTAYTKAMHDGRPWLIATCETLTGGRWEGNVTMLPDTPEARWAVRYGQEES